MTDNSTNPPSIFWVLFQFTGRINREEYWWANGALLGASLVLLYVIIGDRVSLDPSGQIVLPESLSGPFLIITLVSLYVTLAISIKRLHDLGWPGYVAVAFVFPFIGMVAFVLLGVLRGQPDTNKYGPPPR